METFAEACLAYTFLSSSTQPTQRGLSLKTVLATSYIVCPRSYTGVLAMTFLLQLVSSTPHLQVKTETGLRRPH